MIANNTAKLISSSYPSISVSDATQKSKNRVNKLLGSHELIKISNKPEPDSRRSRKSSASKSPLANTPKYKSIDSDYKPENAFKLPKTGHKGNLKIYSTLNVSLSKDKIIGGIDEILGINSPTKKFDNGISKVFSNMKPIIKPEILSKSVKDVKLNPVINQFTKGNEFYFDNQAIKKFKIKPMGMINPNKMKQNSISHIKEEDEIEVEDSFIALLKVNQHTFIEDLNNKKMNNKIKDNIKTDNLNLPYDNKDLTSIFISSDELLSDELQSTKRFDDFAPKKITISANHSEYTSSPISHRSPRLIKEKRVVGRASAIRIFHNDSIKSNAKELKMSYSLQIEKEDEGQESNNEEEMIVEEYLNEDLETIELGKDRFIVDIRELKINVNKDDDEFEFSFVSQDNVVPSK